jgi:hypothetical protein
VLVYPYLTVITGDSKDLDDLAGTSHRAKFYKCRLCTLEECTTPISQPSAKAHRYHENRFVHCNFRSDIKTANDQEVGECCLKRLFQSQTEINVMDRQGKLESREKMT